MTTLPLWRTISRSVRRPVGSTMLSRVMRNNGLWYTIRELSTCAFSPEAASLAFAAPLPGVAAFLPLPPRFASALLPVLARTAADVRFRSVPGAWDAAGLFFRAERAAGFVLPAVKGTSWRTSLATVSNSVARGGSSRVYVPGRRRPARLQSGLPSVEFAPRLSMDSASPAVPVASLKEQIPEKARFDRTDVERKFRRSSRLFPAC
jgi:hypothetical protein